MSRFIRGTVEDTTTSNSTVGTVANITIVDIVHNAKGETVRNKWQACYYCGESHSHFARHLERRHKKELQVEELMTADKRSRSMRITHLRNLGNFKHNTKVMEEKSGVLIVAKRSKGRKPHEYIPCTHCLAMYVECELWRHVKSCPFRPHIAGDDFPSYKDVVADGKMLLFGAAPNNGPVMDIDPDLKAAVIDRLRPDTVLNVVMKDALILRFGSAMLKKVGRQKVK